MVLKNKPHALLMRAHMRCTHRINHSVTSIFLAPTP